MPWGATLFFFCLRFISSLGAAPTTAKTTGSVVRRTKPTGRNSDPKPSLIRSFHKSRTQKNRARRGKRRKREVERRRARRGKRLRRIKRLFVFRGKFHLSTSAKPASSRFNSTLARLSWVPFFFNRQMAGYTFYRSLV